MTELWALLFGWLPFWVQAFIFVLIAIVMIVLVIRVVGAVLDALPFV